METKLSDLCFIKHNFLTSDECDFLVDYYKKNNERGNQEASLDVFDGKRKHSTFEVVEVISRSEEFDFIKNKITEALIEYGKYLENLGIYNTSLLSYYQYSHKYRILKYEVESKIHPHTDHETFNYGSLTFNLNEDYEGGDFTFFGKKFTPKLKKGTLMIFPADIFWTHEVIPVTKGTRYSMNTFIKSQPDPVVRQLKFNHLLELNKEYYRDIDIKDILGPYFPKRSRDAGGY